MEGRRVGHSPLALSVAGPSKLTILLGGPPMLHLEHENELGADTSRHDLSISGFTTEQSKR